MRSSAVLLGLGLLLLSACDFPTPPSDSFPVPSPSASASPPLAYRAFSQGGSLAGRVVPATRKAASMDLTASDGTGLKLVKLSARAVVEDPLALTELHLVFDNPEDRTLEGTFTITLPPNAAISRFAMKIGDAWQEGEVLERQAARRAYEDFLHRKQDPALLEHAAGNQFSARVFPIPAKARKELIVSYSEELGTSAPYTVPLSGLPKLEQVDVSVHAGQGGARAVLSESNYVPVGDFAVERKLLGGGDGVRSGEHAIVRVRPSIANAKDALGSTMILLDTSASRALGLDEQIALVTTIVHGVRDAAGAATQVTVACFDQTIETIFQGPASDYGAAHEEKIKARGALGASDLNGALAWAAKNARGQKHDRLVVVTDGIATAGTTEVSDLAAQAAALKDAGVTRFDAVVAGGIRDEAALRALASSNLGRAGVVIDAAAGAPAVVAKLGKRATSRLEVTIPSATWHWPKTLEGLQEGDDALVYVELPAHEPLMIGIGMSAPTTPDLLQGTPKLVERAWARAKIASLESGEQKLDEAGVKAILDLSTKHRVLSRFTAWLVLETEADYRRFQIDRRSLADILTIRDGRIATTDRTALVPKPIEPRDPPKPPATQPSASAARPTNAVAPDLLPLLDAGVGGPEEDAARGNMWGDGIGDAYGSGGLGLSGIGEGGGGRGEGIGLGNIGGVGHGAGTGSGQGIGSGNGRLGGSHRSTPAEVRMGGAEVSGRLPPAVIQRIVRQNFGRMKLCYENGLRSNPALQGRVTVGFVIGRDGSVGSVSNVGSDIGDAGVVSCVVAAFRGLSFPQPEGGLVQVRYPIAFSPDGSLRASRPPGLPPLPPSPPSDPEPEREKVEPYAGRFLTVMQQLRKKDAKAAEAEAVAWRRDAPGDVMALVALGEVFEAAGDRTRAARAYGSLIDLFPSRADLRRFAGGRLERLERLGDEPTSDLAIDTFKKAVEQRPDHPASHRMLAFALLKRGRHAEAFDAIVAGVTQKYPDGRFAEAERILLEDAGLIAAAWAKAEPARRAEIVEKATKVGAKLDEAPSLRFILTWETDANDVDFHIHDASGGHAFYSERALPSGGELYADVTTGYGPECFTVPLPREKRSESYRLEAHYFARGPMGYGMGKLQIIDHDGAGALSFEERPFVVMADHAYVDLGTVKR